MKARLKGYLLSPVNTALLLSATFVLALSGPFGTFESPFGLRLLYWGLVVGAALLLGWTVRSMVETLFGVERFWRNAAVLVVVHPTLTAPWVYAMTVVLLHPAPGYTLFDFWALILAVDAAIKVVEYGAMRAGFGGNTERAEAAASPDTADSEPATPRLLGRLPEARRGTLIRLSVRDHYVEVVTDRGSERLLMRFSDAMAELDGAEGLQVHRSHWVARDKVVAAERDTGGRTHLKLVDGSNVPVSRSRRPDVEDAGLI